MTDPVDLAREVLDDAQYLASLPSVATVARTQVMIPLAEAAPDLARAVIELTDKLDAERFAHANAAVKVNSAEALADRLEHEAAHQASRGDNWDALCIRAEARRLRAALNGETND